MDKLLDSIENIKLKITDQEYIDIMDSMKEINNQINPIDNNNFKEELLTILKQVNNNFDFLKNSKNYNKLEDLYKTLIKSKCNNYNYIINEVLQEQTNIENIIRIIIHDIKSNLVILDIVNQQIEKLQD